MRVMRYRQRYVHTTTNTHSNKQPTTNNQQVRQASGSLRIVLVAHWSQAELLDGLGLFWEALHTGEK